MRERERNYFVSNAFELIFDIVGWSRTDGCIGYYPTTVR